MIKYKTLAVSAALATTVAVVVGLSSAALADDNGQNNSQQGYSFAGQATSSENASTTNSSEGENNNNLYSYSNAWTGQAHEMENAFANAFGNAVQSGVKAEQMPASLSIDPNGQVRITGANLTVISTSSATINVWGLTFNVNTSQASFAGQDQQSISAADMQVGDKVTVTGTLDPSTGVINARVIVDFSLVSRQSINIVQSRINQLLQLLQQLQGQLNAMQGGSGASSSSQNNVMIPATSTSDQ